MLLALRIDSIGRRYDIDQTNSKFVVDHDDLAARERKGYFSREDWLKCADFGILGLHLPPEYGGQGRDIVTTIAVLEALGYGCRDNGLPFGLNSPLSVPDLQHFPLLYCIWQQYPFPLRFWVPQDSQVQRNPDSEVHL